MRAVAGAYGMVKTGVNDFVFFVAIIFAFFVAFPLGRCRDARPPGPNRCPDRTGGL